MADLSDEASPIAKGIHRRMVEKGMNPTTLAVQVGAGRTYFRDLFEGRSKRPSAQYLTKIAEVLGCEILEILNPGGTQSQPSTDNLINQDEDGQALLALWRLLSDAGKRRLLAAALREAQAILTDGSGGAGSVNDS